MKVLVPPGFMPGSANGMMLIQLCTGQGVETALMAIPGNHDEGEHKKTDMPCAFSGLATPSLAGADPVLLAIAIAFILAAGFRVAATPLLWRGIQVRPPSQGPPALI
ncbi:hypothetical protein ACSMXM_14355 [Pacificimonas sp. ICDLI1SI03]